jgi:hypothetical protein
LTLFFERTDECSGGCPFVCRAVMPVTLLVQRAAVSIVTACACMRGCHWVLNKNAFCGAGSVVPKSTSGFGATVAADEESFELVEPGGGAYADPAMAPATGAVLVAAGDPGLESKASAHEWMKRIASTKTS